MKSSVTVAVVVNRRYAPEAPCGCTFTLTLGEGDALHLALNLLLIGVALGLALEAAAEDPAEGPDPASRRSPGAPPEPLTEQSSKEDR